MDDLYLRELHNDLVETNEALERAKDRLHTDLPGSALSHLNHALNVLHRIKDKLAKEKF